MEESEITKCSLEVETPLVGGYKMKVHAGPGLVGANQGDKEVKFILDGDFSAAGQLSADSGARQAGGHAPLRPVLLPGGHHR